MLYTSCSRKREAIDGYPNMLTLWRERSNALYERASAAVATQGNSLWASGHLTLPICAQRSNALVDDRKQPPRNGADRSVGHAVLTRAPHDRVDVVRANFISHTQSIFVLRCLRVGCEAFEEFEPVLPRDGASTRKAEHMRKPRRGRPFATAERSIKVGDCQIQVRPESRSAKGTYFTSRKHRLRVAQRSRLFVALQCSAGVRKCIRTSSLVPSPSLEQFLGKCPAGTLIVIVISARVLVARGTSEFICDLAHERHNLVHGGREELAVARVPMPATFKFGMHERLDSPAV